MFNDDPYQLLQRSVALALQHVGFSAATPNALVALCDEVESYASRFLSKVTVSMLSSRRSQPIVTDFQYALSEFNIPLLSIMPHLRPPIPAPKLLVQLEPLPTDELAAIVNATLIGDELSGELDKKERPYIPANFPSFPSKHTYKWTEKESARETDARKIREEAAKVARQGEEALRRLTKIGKSAKKKDAKKTASKDPRSKERLEMWEEVMENLLLETNPNSSPTHEISKNIENDSKSMIVNAERQYFRKGPPARRKAPQDPFESMMKV
ncbi:hypothetical protein K3495_g5421 [Podosphaera aphanis]|nr:hypothetical protein K3495_g5421 [Podosphaera aphanis]